MQMGVWRACFVSFGASSGCSPGGHLTLEDTYGWEAPVCLAGSAGCALWAPVVAQSGLWGQRAVGHLFVLHELLSVVAQLIA